jgi:CRISPR-associated protein Csd1
MILQALKEYYDRKPDLPAFGWFDGFIDFAIVLDTEGNFLSLQPYFEVKNNKKTRYLCRLPYIGKQARKHTMSGDDANLLWDNATFVLGIGKNGNKKLNSFIDAIEKYLSSIEDQSIDAVLTFLKNGQNDRSRFDPIINDEAHGKVINEGGPTLTFRIINDDSLFVFDRPLVKNRVSDGLIDSDLVGTCLVTGKKNSKIEINHLVIKNLYGARKDPNVVSFNDQAYRSYGKNRGDNAPVCIPATFAYTTALNHLTASDSNRLKLGDATVVFWSEKKTKCSKEVEDFFGSVAADDPDRMISSVRALFRSVNTGAFAEEDLTSKFFVLGMTPFGPRIAIRFFIIDTVKGMSGKICAHFNDIEVDKSRVPSAGKESTRLSLAALLAATAREVNFDNKKPHLVFYRGRYFDVRPNLEGELVRAILQGLPYPQILLQSTIMRIQAEQAKKDSKTGKSLPNVTYPRAALIKGCLNRLLRINNPEQQEEIKVSLDRENKNIGYRLGRLFATLEKIQAESHPKINSTIRDKFYGAASSCPVTVFGNLMRLKNHHLAKLESRGRRVNFEQLIGEIMNGIEDFPPHLKLLDQGRFAIGYYHQMNDFFTK